MDGYFSLTSMWMIWPVIKRLPSFPDMDFLFLFRYEFDPWMGETCWILGQVKSVINAVSLCDWMARHSLKAFTWSLFCNLLTLKSSSQGSGRPPIWLRSDKAQNVSRSRCLRLFFFCQIFNFSVCHILPTLMFTEGCKNFNYLSLFCFLSLTQFEFLWLRSDEDWTAVVELTSQLSMALHHSHDYFCSTLTNRKLKIVVTTRAVF